MRRTLEWKYTGLRAQLLTGIHSTGLTFYLRLAFAGTISTFLLSDIPSFSYPMLRSWAGPETTFPWIVYNVPVELVQRVSSPDTIYTDRSIIAHQDTESTFTHDIQQKEKKKSDSDQEN